ncbi:MAG: hypothetical protein Q7R83_02685 [bacterium]|nr:hypothetical protein [bacterium]
MEEKAEVGVSVFNPGSPQGMAHLMRVLAAIQDPPDDEDPVGVDRAIDAFQTALKVTKNLPWVQTLIADWLTIGLNRLRGMLSGPSPWRDERRFLEFWYSESTRQNLGGYSLEKLEVLLKRDNLKEHYSEESDLYCRVLQLLWLGTIQARFKDRLVHHIKVRTGMNRRNDSKRDSDHCRALMLKFGLSEIEADAFAQ